MDINLNSTESATDGFDASDARLVEALREGLSHGRFEVGVDAPALGSAEEEPAAESSAHDSSADEERAAQHEMAFLQALNAFRAAKKSQDPEAIRAAERHLQEVTRAELEEFEAARTQQ